MCNPVSLSRNSAARVSRDLFGCAGYVLGQRSRIALQLFAALAQRQQIFHARQKFNRVGRFIEKIARAELERAMADLAILFAGDHHQRRLRLTVRLVVRLDELEPVHPLGLAHAIVENDQIVFLFAAPN